MTEPAALPGGEPISLRRGVGWALLVLALLPGTWLLYQVHAKTGLDAPRFWELLRDEPVFGLAMLDFFLTAGWALLAMWDLRPARLGWRFWLPVGLFCAVPSVGLGLFVLLRPRGGAVVLRGRPGREASTG